MYLYRITHRVRKLLMLIPTDPQISETLECIANKVRLVNLKQNSCVLYCSSQTSETLEFGKAGVKFNTVVQ